MKFNLIASLIALISLASCSKNGFENSNSKTEYLKEIEGLSENSLKNQLKSDREYIQKLVEEVDGYEFYFTMSFGFGEGGTKDEIDTAEIFSLPNADSVKLDFKNLKNNLFAEQKFSLPHSKFEFYPDSEQYAFANLNTDEIQYEILQTYSGKNLIDAKKVGLKYIDSLTVKVSYEFPTQFDTLVLDILSKDSIQYKDFVIKIDTVSSDRAGLKIPFELYKDIIGENGITQEGILVSHNSYSAYPVMGLNPKIIEELNQTRKLMEEAEKVSDKEEMMKILDKIPESVFTHKNKINAYISDAKGLDKLNDKEFDEVTKAFREFESKYEDILWPIYQTVEVSFPNEIDKIYFYVADSKKKLTQNVIAVNEIPLQETKVFYDESKEKYGIMDKNGQIVIPAEYNELYQNDDFYYNEIQDSITVGYYLDLKNKKLEKLPANVKFFKKLNDEYAVFTDKNDYKGVLKNRKDEVIPYEYNNIDLAGNTFVLERSKRGRIFYEFRKLDGSKIEIPERISDVSFYKNNPNIVVISRDEKYGLIDKNGKLSIPLSDSPIDMVSPNLIDFSVKDGYGEIFGIKAISGKIIVNPKYYDLGYLSDGRAMFSIIENGEKKFGYLNENAQEVIPATYNTALDFYKGMAMVEKDYKVYLIDTTGKVVVNMPSDPDGNYLDSKNDGTGFIYILNDNYYDYKGNLIK